MAEGFNKDTLLENEKAGRKISDISPRHEYNIDLGVLCLTDFTFKYVIAHVLIQSRCLPDRPIIRGSLYNCTLYTVTRLALTLHTFKFILVCRAVVSTLSYTVSPYA